MPYHLKTPPGPPPRPPREHLHCYEGALFAAAALRLNGYPPLILDLEAEHDTDHVIAVYQVDGCWGAVAKSNYTRMRYREPVYRTLRELASATSIPTSTCAESATLRTFSRPCTCSASTSPLDDLGGTGLVCGGYLLTSAHFAGHTQTGEAVASP